MKKYYEKPSMAIEVFYTEDIMENSNGYTTAIKAANVLDENNQKVSFTDFNSFSTTYTNFKGSNN